MTTEINFDAGEFIDKAKALGAAEDQLLYILARTLNDAAEKTRSYLIETTWPSSVKMRNASFIGAALTTRDARATKSNLEVAIYDKLGRANLALHAKGGTRTAKGSNIAVPSSTNVTRTARGAVRTDQRPRNLARSFRKGQFIFQVARQKRTKKSPEGGRLRLMYTLKSRVPIKQDVPFHRDFTDTMRQSILEALPDNVARAMATRRSK